MIQFKCACCGQLLQLADEWAGKVAKCPFSGQYMQVPLPAPVPPPAPARAPAVSGQVPAAPARVPAAPAQAPAPAAAGGGFSAWNPFASAEPPPADFGTFSSAVSTATQGQVRSKSRRAAWQARGAALGAAGGLVLGSLFGLMFIAVAKTGGQPMLAWLTIALGAAVLGAGVGGIIGPLVMILMPGGKNLAALADAMTGKNLSGTGAVMGALYGTVRVGGFGAIGGLVPGILSGAFLLLKTGDVAPAAMTAILTAILMSLGWAAAGAIIGVFFGAALGAVGGYEP